MPSFGTVKTWRNDRGFGFLKADQMGDDVFVGIRDLQASGLESLVIGQRVSYEPAPDRRNPTKLRAVDLRIIGAS